MDKDKEEEDTDGVWDRVDNDLKDELNILCPLWLDMKDNEDEDVDDVRNNELVPNRIVDLRSIVARRKISY